MKRSLPGVNIQHPISGSILDGSKTIETRTYALPLKYVGRPMWLIETPGASKGFKARIVAVITFGEPFEYKTKKSFYDDFKRHKVSQSSPWAWKEKSKWGWPILKVETLKKPPLAPSRRGFVFTGPISL